jgi:hypothetical protein
MHKFENQNINFFWLNCFQIYLDFQFFFTAEFSHFLITYFSNHDIPKIYLQGYKDHRTFHVYQFNQFHNYFQIKILQFHDDYSHTHKYNHFFHPH